MSRHASSPIMAEKPIHNDPLGEGDDFVASFQVEDAGAVAARADEVLLAVTVRDAMTSLSPVHREVLELVYDEDMKLAEIAERLDVPLGTVKTRAHHALRGLRRALEERGWDG